MPRIDTNFHEIILFYKRVRAIDFFADS